MAPPVDRDKLFLDIVISLADDLYQLADAIITATEDPDVIIPAKNQKRIAALIEKMARDYRPRLEQLKQLETKPVQFTIKTSGGQC